MPTLRFRAYLDPGLHRDDVWVLAAAGIKINVTPVEAGIQTRSRMKPESRVLNRAYCVCTIALMAS
jgi:hypothetical protein